jgi:hypothetical protein
VDKMPAELIQRSTGVKKYTPISSPQHTVRDSDCVLQVAMHYVLDLLGLVWDKG